MNIMNIPGFSAEASLYRSSAHHQVGAVYTGFKQGGEVVPSAFKSYYFCDDRHRFCKSSITVPGYVRVDTLCFYDGICYQVTSDA